jgi:hypothetical protein
MISDYCEMFGSLPVAGGILDQPSDLMEGIRLWRFMKHVNDLKEHDDGMDQIMKSPAMFHMMNIIDMGEEEANALRDEAEERSHRAVKDS